MVAATTLVAQKPLSMLIQSNILTESGDYPHSLEKTTMKKFFLSALLLLPAICMAQSSHNVTLTMHVSPYINEVEQTAYVYTLLGNEYNICDSVSITPEKSTYTLQAYVPYENELILMFSKRGPLHMVFLVSSKDKVEVEITEEDNLLGMTYKKLIKGGKHHQAFLDFWQTSGRYNEQRMLWEDSLSLYGISEEKMAQLNFQINRCRTEKLEYVRDIARHSTSPYLVDLSHSLLVRQFGKDEYRELVKYNYKRFPSYPPIQRSFLGQPWPNASAQSKVYRKIIKRVESSRVSVISHVQKNDTLAVGDTMHVTLTDSLGQSHPVSSFKGKYVLVEIWASWCIPCIQAMPNIVLAQRMFQNDFVCCAVSIDKDDKIWRQSIPKHRLETLHHYKGTDTQGVLREDMKKLVADGSIPRNYLLDREGRIIAIDIYDDDLIKKLEELTREGAQ